MTIRNIGEKRSGMIIDSVAASLPVVTLYQVNHNRSHKFKNMRSAERYKLHMHVSHKGNLHDLHSLNLIVCYSDYYNMPSIYKTDKNLLIVSPFFLLQRAGYPCSTFYLFKLVTILN
jgi:hypothetical protein